MPNNCNQCDDEELPVVEQPAPPPCEEGEDCEEVYEGDCVKYTGDPLTCLGITTNMSLNNVVLQLAKALCPCLTADNLVAAEGTSSIVLTWDSADTLNTTGQYVQRRITAGTFANISTLLAKTVETYTDTTVLPNTLYFYRVSTECEINGPVYSAETSEVDFVCPEITTEVTGNQVVITLPSLSNELEYDYILVQSGVNPPVLDEALTSGQLADSKVIAGLSPGTYDVTVTTKVYTLENDCTVQFTIV